MTTDDTDVVLRLQARLMEVERRGQMARVTFAVHVGPDVDRLARETGNSCLLGVLMASDIPPEAPPDDD